MNDKTSAEFRDILILLEEKLKKDPEIKNMTKKLSDLLSLTTETYRKSDGCSAFLKDISTQLVESQKSTYTIIQSISVEFKNHKSNQPVPKKRAATVALPPVESERAASASNPNMVVEETNTVGNDESSNTVSPATGGSRKQLAALRRAVRMCEKQQLKILKETNRLQEEELSVDDLEKSNAFIWIEKLSKEAMRLERKLKILRKEESNFGRPVQARVQFTGTKFPTVDRAITNFICQKNKKFRGQYFNFPNIQEILSILKKENSTNSLQWTDAYMEEQACKITNDVIALLKKKTVADRRQIVDDIEEAAREAEDFPKESEKFEDPAIKDEELSKKLNLNKLAAAKRCQKEIAKFEREPGVELPALVKDECQNDDVEVTSKNGVADDVFDECPSLLPCPDVRQTSGQRSECKFFEQERDDGVIVIDDEDEPSAKKMKSEETNEKIDTTRDVIDITGDSDEVYNSDD